METRIKPILYASSSALMCIVAIFVTASIGTTIFEAWKKLDGTARSTILLAIILLIGFVLLFIIFYYYFKNKQKTYDCHD